ncbi:VWA domain-containing protein [Sessilibacter sp. MAH4]
MISEFHFVRPYWLFALVPLIVIAVLIANARVNQSDWKKFINPNLLNHLLEVQGQSQGRWPYYALLVIWLTATIAGAGPTWQKIPQPTLKKDHSLVILWDMSPSMLAEDLKPSRLDRSRFKLIDLLHTRKEGQTGLVVYAGESYVVTPMSDDTSTITSQLSALEPGLMPIRGSNTEMAIEDALKLFRDSGVVAGDILLISDGVVPLAAQTVSNLLESTPHRLSVLGVGTPEGAPVPFGDEFAQDQNGQVIIDKLDVSTLETLAHENSGIYASLSSNSSDIDRLSAFFNNERDFNGDAVLNEDREFDSWYEFGPWAVLCLLPLVAVSFRRGWLFAFAMVMSSTLFVSASNPAQAASWKDLWSTKDQQAKALLDEGNAEQAAELFKDQQWKAVANYRGENFENAAGLFNGDDAVSHYNRGNALANAGKLDEAIAQYDEALKIDPDLTVAQENKEIVENLKRQQQQSQQSDQNSDQNQQNNQDQQNQDSQNQDSQSQESQNQDSQNQQANSDQQQQDASQQDSQQQDQQQAQNEQQEQESKEQSEQQQQAANEEQSDEQSGEDGEQESVAEVSEGDLSEEQQQALEQWLKQIPDDPSGLLRRKFQHEYRKRAQQYRAGQWQPPSNNAASRL